MDAASSNQAIQDLVRAKNSMDVALKSQADANTTFATVSQQKAAKDASATDAVNTYNAALDALGALLPSAKLIIPQGKVSA